jgi:hypothetical protein
VRRYQKNHGLAKEEEILLNVSGSYFPRSSKVHSQEQSFAADNGMVAV